MLDNEMNQKRVNKWFNRRKDEWKNKQNKVTIEKVKKNKYDLFESYNLLKRIKEIRR